MNIGLALALLRGVAKDEVRTGAWEENKVIMVKATGMMMIMMILVLMVIMVKAIRIATTTSVMIMARTRITTTMQI